MSKQIPIITIDGPSGSGKGSLGVMLAKHLKYHLLDSGALYRLLALAIRKSNINIADHLAIQKVALNLDVRFIETVPGEPAAIILDNQDVSDEIRKEYCGDLASRISSYQVVRDSLFALQRSFIKEPGLVADGRDMGTVVFPEAKIKFFLTASQEERAKRRLMQIKSRDREYKISLDELLEDIKQRDFRDTTRIIAPLRPAEDAIIIDSSALSKEQVFKKMLASLDH